MGEVKDPMNDPRIEETAVEPPAIHSVKLHDRLRRADNRSSVEIRHDIEATRRDIDETASALRERLAVEELATDAFDAVRSSFRSKSPAFFDSLKRNPGPTALCAFGLGWMIYRGTSSGQATARYSDMTYSAEGGEYGMKEGVSDTAGNVGKKLGDVKDRMADRMGEMKGKVGEKIGNVKQNLTEKAHGTYDSLKGRAADVSHRASDRIASLGHRTTDAVRGTAQTARERTANIASNVGDKVGQMTSGAGQIAKEKTTQMGHFAQQEARVAKDKVVNAYEVNPMALGAIALALGAACALLMPQTETENRVMGEKRDDLMDKAKGTVDQVRETGKQTYERVKEVASRTTDEIKNEMSMASGSGATRSTEVNVQSTQPGDLGI